MTIFISHRGNVTGPTPDENEPGYVANALKKGYNVEVDVWLIEGQWLLGHDHPTYDVSASWLNNKKLWLHCKNVEALSFLSDCNQNHHYFWHENDRYALTSKCFVWTHPGIYIPSQNGIAVMPEKAPSWNLTNAVGICSDYIQNYRRKLA